MNPIDPKNLPTDKYIDGSHGTSGKSGWYLRLYYKVTSQNVANNTSTVNLQLYIYDALVNRGIIRKILVIIQFKVALRYTIHMIMNLKVGIDLAQGL